MTALPTGLTSGTWNLDPSHTEASFTVRHAGISKVRGTVAVTSGTLTVGEDLESSSVAVTLGPSPVATPMRTLEGRVVQDADRLDAIGAVGIARTFAYGGHAGQPMHDPSLAAEAHVTFADYKTKRTSTINHFHEKLLLLKDRMNTASGRRLAEGRHAFMETFLKQFDDEWQGRS